MKKILLLLLIPVVGMGQENIADSIKKYVKLEVDDITGAKAFKSDQIMAFSKDMDILVISFEATDSKSLMSINFYCKGLICCRDNAKIRFLLDQDIRAVLDNSLPYNCNGIQSTSFWGKGREPFKTEYKGYTPEAEDMSTVKPKAVRLEGTGKVIDFYFAPAQAEKFRVTFASFEKLVGVWSENNY